jgi:hypothetical protein
MGMAKLYGISKEFIMTIFEQAEQVRQTAANLPHHMPNSRWWLLQISRHMLDHNLTFQQAAQYTTTDPQEDLLWH